MTDRELLELAAKAAGIDDAQYVTFNGMNIRYVFSEAIWSDDIGEYWNPLADDADALRLAVKLKIDILHSVISVRAIQGFASSGAGVRCDKEFDRGTATRRAIVRAAAEIGRQMP